MEESHRFQSNPRVLSIPCQGINPLAFQYLEDKALFSVIVLTEKSLGILNRARYLDRACPCFFSLNSTFLYWPPAFLLWVHNSSFYWWEDVKRVWWSCGSPSVCFSTRLLVSGYSLLLTEAQEVYWCYCLLTNRESWYFADEQLLSWFYFAPFLETYSLLLIRCICVSLWVCMCTWVPGPEEARHVRSLELELQWLWAIWHECRDQTEALRKHSVCFNSWATCPANIAVTVVLEKIYWA